MIFLIKLVLLALPATFFAAVAAVVLGGFLVLTGTPSACVDREVSPAPAASQELQERWLDVARGVALGETIRLSVTEEQATSLGAVYLEMEDVDVEDFRVLFCPDGLAEASGRVGALGLKSNVLVRGRVDVGGERPRVEFESVHFGGFPSFLAKPIVDLLVDPEEARTLPLVEHIDAIEYGDGEIIVTVTPR